MKPLCTNAACKRPSEDPLCWDCTRKLRETLDDIPRLDGQLADIALYGFGAGGDTGRPHWTPLPFEAEASQYRDTLRNLLVRCVKELCETRGVEWQPLWALPDESLPWGYTPTTVDLAAWLDHYATSLRLDATAGETHLEIVRAVEHGNALIDRLPPTYRGPCPAVVGHDQRDRPLRCGAELYSPPGASVIDCPRCKAQHRADDLEQKHLHDLGKRPFRAAVLLRTLDALGEPLPEQTFYLWVRDRRLKPAAWQRPDGTVTSTWIDRRDPALYRLDDVRKLRAEVPKRKSRERTA